MRKFFYQDLNAGNEKLYKKFERIFENSKNR